MGTAGPLRSLPCSWSASRRRTDLRKEPFFSGSRPPRCLGRPGLGSAGVPARPGLAPAGGPAAWPVACSPCCAQGLGGRGPESLARSPRAHTRAHTLPPVACFPLATMVADTKVASARVFVVPLPSPHPLLFPEATQAADGSRGPPRLGFCRGAGGIFMKSLRAWRLLAMAYVATPGSHPRAKRPSWIFTLFSLKIRNGGNFLESPWWQVAGRVGKRTRCIGNLKC